MTTGFTFSWSNVNVKAGKKILRRLEARQRGHAELMAKRSDGKVEQRKQSGGYTLPGSRKKG